jgi:DNA-binding NarL/FixJ family response regulator
LCRIQGVLKERGFVARARILLADDFEGIRDQAQRLLEPEFDIVAVVGNGTALLEAVREMQPDVCVIDISMPVLSGIDAADQLKASGSTANIVFLTVHEDLEFVQAALATGALGYVLKSRMASDLCLAVKEAMAGRLFVSSSLSPTANC